MSLADVDPMRSAVGVVGLLSVLWCGSAAAQTGESWFDPPPTGELTPAEVTPTKNHKNLEAPKAAEPLEPLATPEPSFFGKGYRPTLLWVDGIAFSSTALGALATTAVNSGRENGGLEILFPLVVVSGAGTLALGGPVVHLAHGNYGRAVGSLGLRVMSATALFAVGYGVAKGQDNSCDGGLCGLNWLGTGVIAGALVGLPVGAMLDNILLGNPEPSSTPRSALRLSPYADVQRGNFGLQLGGAF